MAMKKPGWGGAFGDTKKTISPKELRAREERKYFKEHFVGEWDYEKGKRQGMSARDYEDQFRRQMLQNQPSAAAMQQQMMHDRERHEHMRRQQDMAMKQSPHYLTTSGSTSVMIGKSAGYGQVRNKKGEEVFNWKGDLRTELQKETDAWLEDALAA